MRFDILTLFPELFDSVFSQSIVKRAMEAGQITIAVHNIRDYALDKHHITDDMPYGGGGGMVMKVEPIVLAVEAILGPERVAAQKQTGDVQVPVVLMTPAGRLFSQRIAHEYEQYGHVVLICGRYEGIDERVSQLVVTDEVSIGDYVLSGGEIPAMVVVDAVARLVPGVLGNELSALHESFESGLLEYPQYTRPESFRGEGVPEVLLSGHHAEIEKWRRREALRRTLARRPDLLEKVAIKEEERCFLEEERKRDGNRG